MEAICKNCAFAEEDVLEQWPHTGIDVLICVYDLSDNYEEVVGEGNRCDYFAAKDVRSSSE